MASTMYTESLSQLIKHMGSGNFIRAKYIRRGIDRQKEAVNWLQLDQEYMQRFNALKKAVEASDKRDTQMLKFTGEEFGAFSGKSMKMSTARKFIHTVEDTEGKGAGDRLTYRELSETVIPKFYSELKDVKEMGQIFNKSSQRAIAIMLSGVKDGKYDAMDLIRGIKQGNVRDTSKGVREMLQVLWSKVEKRFRKYLRGKKRR